jgi:urease accessory protein
MMSKACSHEAREQDNEPRGNSMQMMSLSRGLSLALAAPTVILVCAALLVDPAAAHHPTGGMTPQTLWHGLLSGLGHPVIGLDHFSFIVATGIAAALLPGGMAIPVGFIVASAVGVLAHVARLDVPMAEIAVAASVIAAGLSLALRLPLRALGWTALAILAGVFHGYAFGETVVGAERGVIGAYVAGIAIVAIAIAALVKFATLALTAPTAASSLRLTGAGAVLSCLGVVFLTMALRAG